MYVVVSSCCAKKDDSVPIPKGSRVIERALLFSKLGSVFCVTRGPASEQGQLTRLI